MRITDARTVVIGTSWRNLILVKVTTDEGVYGVGEATTQNREEGVVGYLRGLFKRFVLGANPLRIEDLANHMYRDEFWRGGVVAMSGLSAVEMACWDILGKVTGQPVYQLLGGACWDRLKAYANGWYQTETRAPAEFARLSKGVRRKGYTALKVDPFGPGFYELEPEEFDRSVEIVAAIRDAVGPRFEIHVEGHGRFTPAQALALARALAPSRPSWFEEPVPPENLEALRRVVEASPVPVATGERVFGHVEYGRLFQHVVPDIVQPDLAHAGGFLGLKKIAAMADAHYVTVAPHNANSPFCTAATAHACAAMTNFKILEVFDDFQEPWLWDIFSGVPRVVDGCLPLPSGPGIGADLNEDAAREHPYVQGFFNLFEAGWERRRFSRDGPAPAARRAKRAGS
jgi:galactonate dehydratase